MSELSMIDTAILIAGVLTSGIYFSAAAQDEPEIRELAGLLYRRHGRIDGPLFLGIDTHALSESAFATALEVPAATLFPS